MSFTFLNWLWNSRIVYLLNYDKECSPRHISQSIFSWLWFCSSFSMFTLKCQFIISSFSTVVISNGNAVSRLESPLWLQKKQIPIDFMHNVWTGSQMLHVEGKGIGIELRQE